MTLGFVVPAPRPGPHQRAVSVRDVIDATARALRLRPADLLGPDRHMTIARARHAAMFVARRLVGASFPEIGRAFGSRDHTTVMHACRKVQASLDAGDERTRLEVEAVELDVRVSVSAEERSRRPREVRARTENMLRLPKRELEAGRVHLHLVGEVRPATRGDCAEVERPCPWVSCRHNLFLDAEGAALKFNFPDLEPDQVEHSCALDAADEGGITLEEVGRVMNLTRERVRQIEVRALARVRRRSNLDEFTEHHGEIHSGKGATGGKLGGNAEAAERIERTEREEAPIYSSSTVWPANPADLNPEPDLPARMHRLGFELVGGVWVRTSRPVPPAVAAIVADLRKLADLDPAHADLLRRLAERYLAGEHRA